MKQVKNGDTVTVNYTGRLEDGSIFDSSKMPGRTPLSAILGQGQLIPGFENGIIGMTIGESKTIEIEPKDAYGLHNPAMTQEVFRTSLPPDIFVGGVVRGNDGQGKPLEARVISVNEKTAVLDFNHPLSGKKLIFEVELIHIN